ncbi:hypothetical protein MMC22_008707 [Lobaria immixta]|nr:hypothetical protein [Lobaria immixta]
MRQLPTPTIENSNHSTIHKVKPILPPTFSLFVSATSFGAKQLLSSCLSVCVAGTSRRRKLSGSTSDRQDTVSAILVIASSFGKRRMLSIALMFTHSNAKSAAGVFLPKTLCSNISGRQDTVSVVTATGFLFMCMLLSSIMKRFTLLNATSAVGSFLAKISCSSINGQQDIVAVESAIDLLIRSMLLSSTTMMFTLSDATSAVGAFQVKTLCSSINGQQDIVTVVSATDLLIRCMLLSSTTGMFTLSNAMSAVGAFLLKTPCSSINGQRDIVTVVSAAGAFLAKAPCNSINGQRDIVTVQSTEDLENQFRLAMSGGLQIQGLGCVKVVLDEPIPEDDILVIVAELTGEKDPISGCDSAGTLGLKQEDRVAGYTRGANVVNHESGAFAEHIIATGDLQLKIPGQFSPEEATALGVGVSTVGQGFYKSLRLPLPDQRCEKAFPVLIYGASTATGTLAVQYAKLSGLQVMATCSLADVDLVKSLGADFVFDHDSESCASEIRQASHDSLQHVFDCISTDATAKTCADSFGSQQQGGRRYSSLRWIRDFPRKDVTTAVTVAYTTFAIETFKCGARKLPATELEDVGFDIIFARLTSELKTMKLGNFEPETATATLETGNLRQDDEKRG